MLELRLAQAGLLRKVLEATRELLTTANFDFSPAGVSLQAMDSSHVALVALLLTAAGFDRYRCDRPRSVGIHLRHLARFLRCAANDDLVTLKAHDEDDSLTLLFESSNQDKIQDNEIKMMVIDSEHLGIPEAEYQATVVMPSQEFARLCRDLSSIGDSVIISVTKEGVKFSTSGEMGNANIIYRPHASPDKPEESILIEVSEPVTLSFALRYMSSFTKATPLSSTVAISMSSDLPMSVEYKIADMGYIRYYLAPKVEEDEQQQ